MKALSQPSQQHAEGFGVNPLTHAFRFGTQTPMGGGRSVPILTYGFRRAERSLQFSAVCSQVGDMATLCVRGREGSSVLLEVEVEVEHST